MVDNLFNKIIRVGCPNMTSRFESYMLHNGDFYGLSRDSFTVLKKSYPNTFCHTFDTMLYLRKISKIFNGQSKFVLL